MRYFKYFIVFCVLTLIAYFAWVASLPSTFTITKQVEFQKDLSQAYEITRDFSFYTQWYPLSKAEPTNSVEITGSGKDLHNKWVWDGQLTGKGISTHSVLKKDELIINTNQIEKPWKNKTKDIFIIRYENGTKILRWKMQSLGNTPWWKRRSEPKRVELLMEQGLKDLKYIIEKYKPAPSGTGKRGIFALMSTDSVGTKELDVKVELHH